MISWIVPHGKLKPRDRGQLWPLPCFGNFSGLYRILANHVLKNYLGLSKAGPELAGWLFFFWHLHN
jgi:hypothetical protein